MPVVRVSFYQGRSPQQKRQIAEAITDALVRIAGSKRDAVNVIFDNVANYLGFDQPQAAGEMGLPVAP